MSSIADWRRKPPLPLLRSVASVRKELIGARVLDVGEWGSSLTLELLDGSKVEYGVSGYEYDIELNPVQ